jgi:hypothetical protein
MAERLALSIRQPWAGLLVQGLKTIEIRRWSTDFRGPLLIHASSTPDPRAEAWARLTPGMATATEFYGGVIGEAVLVDCISYEDPARFSQDQARHLNYPDWFLPPLLYGFVFAQPRLLPFFRFTGDVKFFRVPGMSA